ncbi:polyhydroxyalkanoic acid system family protein [Luteimonas sp. SJ-92]|uniref:Polyhydroxyalkanoic acid system family protein n=1 Tax=Luteimonas salinisoli TaxID=2752307 RepID=A0A853JA32_9GAMM|nr:polyhydroxyalkanoic acid system family protein [Luteimonas salinisoli]NZA26033.1 polyhydroxyalkanoic acid system family protein [Luteimonas salinisoli]
MSGIDIHHPHSLPMPEARARIDEVAQKLSERFGLECAWEGDSLGFERSGVQGRIDLAPDELHVTAKLGFLLSAMHGPIEGEIRRVLEEKFAA